MRKWDHPVGTPGNERQWLAVAVWLAPSSLCSACVSGRPQAPLPHVVTRMPAPRTQHLPVRPGAHCTAQRHEAQLPAGHAPPPVCDSGTTQSVFSLASSYLPLPLTSSHRGFELWAWRQFQGLSSHPSSITRSPSASGPPPSLHIRKLPAGRSCITGHFAEPAWSPCQGCLPPGKHLFSVPCWEHLVPEA